LEADRSPWPAT